MTVSVECYSGRKADERPVRFSVDGQVYMVKEVVGQWYGTDDDYFKVRADDGNLYVLRHRRGPDGDWTLESFRRGQ